MPPRSPWQIQRAVVFALMLRELRARAGAHWLGLMWLVFEPLAHLAVLMTMFLAIRHITRGSLEVPVFLVTGLLPFFVFRSVALRVGDSIPANRGLFGYRQVKPVDTMVARALVEVLLHTAVYLALLAVLGWLGYQWWPHRPLELVALSCLLIAFSFGVALVIAVATLRRPRVRAVIGILLVPLYLVSGVIFQVGAAPPAIREWLLLNPVLHFIELGRDYFIPHYPRLQQVNVFYPAAWTVVTLALGMALYRLDRHRLRARD